MAEQVDLGRISLGKNTKIFVLGLPSKTKSIVVRYKPSSDDEWHDDWEGDDEDPPFRVSCVVPPAKHHVTTEDDWGGHKRFKVSTPHQLISIDYCDIPRYKKAQRAVLGHWHFAINMAHRNKILLKPYIMANTSFTGAICFGNNLVPADLKQTYTYFWSSLFNDELRGSLAQARRKRKFSKKLKLPTTQSKMITSYYGKVLPAQKWENKTDFVCGEKYWGSPKGAFGIIITDQKSLLKKIPKKFRKNNANPSQGSFIIVKANPTDGGDWLCESGDFKFVLDGRNVSLHHKARRLTKKIKKLLATSPA